jgi:5'-methylthioadenosine phosphorylase
MSLLSFIGGTGFDLRGDDSPFSSPSDSVIRTRFGPASITRAYLDDQEVVFLHRHARPDEPHIKDVPPHRLNYRANIAALKFIGVTGIFASSAVGSLRPEWVPGTLVCLDNFMDYTTNRNRTFSMGARFTLMPAGPTVPICGRYFWKRPTARTSGWKMAAFTRGWMGRALRQRRKSGHYAFWALMWWA